MTDPTGYASAMTDLYQAYTKLGWSLRDKKPDESAEHIKVIMRSACRINDFINGQNERPANPA